MNTPSKKVFISYAHNDEAFFKVFAEGLRNHLFSSSKYNFGAWEDSKICLGTFWDLEIQNNLSESDVAILCVSASFLNSKYIEVAEFGVLVNKFPKTLIIPVYFNHCNIQSWDELAKIQFFKPKGDKYDKHTKDDFAFCDLISFIQTDGRPLPNSNIELYYKDLVSKIEIAIEEKDRFSAFQHENASNLFSSSLIPKPSKIFTGRHQELKEFEQKFKTGNIFSIVGLGGTGKSEFAAKFIANFSYKKVVWFDCKNNSSFESLIETAGYINLLKVETTNKLATFIGFKELIERDEKIIFIDNYHNSDEHLFEMFFRFLKNSLIKAKIVLICREKITFDDVDMITFKLEGLKEHSLEYAKKVIERNYLNTVIISDSKLNTICDDLQGHPFAIQLAIQLVSYEGNADNILVTIREYGKERDKLSLRLLGEIFNHSKSTEEEKRLLMYFSAFRGEVEKKAIQILYGNDYQQPLGALIDKLMISQNLGKYLVHPLVREFAYLKLERKKEIHKLAIKYYLEIVENTYSLNTQEEILYHIVKAEEYEFGVKYFEDHSENLLAHGLTSFVTTGINFLIAKGFKSQKLYIMLLDAASYLGGAPKERLEIIKQTFLLAPQSPEILLEARISELEILFDLGELANQIHKIEETLKECEKINFAKGESVCLALIAKYYLERDEVNSALKNAEKALSISTSIDYYAGKIVSRIVLAECLRRKKKYRSVYEIYELLIEEANKLSSIRDIGVGKNGLAVIHSDRGENLKALDIFQEILKNCVLIGDKLNESVECYNIANELLNMNNNSGFEYLNRSLSIAISISDYKLIADCYFTFALHYDRKLDYNNSLKYLLKSLAYCNKKGMNCNYLIDLLFTTNKKMGNEDYLRLLHPIYKLLPNEEQNNIDIFSICFQPISIKKDPGRNDLCPCGSGVKFKKCHGK